MKPASFYLVVFLSFSFSQSQADEMGLLSRLTQSVHHAALSGAKPSSSRPCVISMPAVSNAKILPVSLSTVPLRPPLFTTSSVSPTSFSSVSAFPVRHDFTPYLLPSLANMPSAIPPLLPADTCALSGVSVVRMPGEEGVCPLKNPPIVLPSVGITTEHAQQIQTRIVYSGLMDGSLNPRSPEWRPYLASMLDKPETKNPDSIFSLILAGCAGNAEPARIALAQKWAQEHENGRFSGTMDFFVARHYFLSASYPEAIRRAGLVAKQHPELAVKALLLNALAEAHNGKTKNASSIIKDILKKYPDSPDIPEIRYMEAWLALQEWRNEEAKKLLKAIVADYPSTPTATKAEQMLTTLETHNAK